MYHFLILVISMTCQFLCSIVNAQGIGLCLTQDLPLSTDQFTEIVVNTSTASNRTINLQAPAIQNASGIKFFIEIPTEALEQCKVEVDLSQSIFGPNAGLFIYKNFDESRLEIEIRGTNCLEVTANGQAFNIQISDLVLGFELFLYPGGDIAIVVVADI